MELLIKWKRTESTCKAVIDVKNQMDGQRVINHIQNNFIDGKKLKFLNNGNNQLSYIIEGLSIKTDNKSLKDQLNFI